MGQLFAGGEFAEELQDERDIGEGGGADVEFCFHDLADGMAKVKRRERARQILVETYTVVRGALISRKSQARAWVQ